MTTQELRELDAWIAEYVMGWAVDFQSGRRKNGPGFQGQKIPKDNSTWAQVQNYTTDPAAAMDVLKKCAKKIPKDCHISISPDIEESCVWCNDNNGTQWSGLGPPEALELAICLFAKRLFSQK